MLDGSAKGWVEAVEQVGVCVAKDSNGSNKEKMAPFLHKQKYVWRKDSFIMAFPSSKTHITYGINFPLVQFSSNDGFIYYFYIYSTACSLIT